MQGYGGVRIASRGVVGDRLMHAIKILSSNCSGIPRGHRGTCPQSIKSKPYFLSINRSSRSTYTTTQRYAYLVSRHRTVVLVPYIVALRPGCRLWAKIRQQLRFPGTSQLLEKVAILLDALCIWSPKDTIERPSRCQSVIETSTTSSAPSKADARAGNGGSVGSLELEGTSSKSGEHDRADVGADL